MKAISMAVTLLIVVVIGVILLLVGYGFIHTAKGQASSSLRLTDIKQCCANWNLAVKAHEESADVYCPSKKPDGSHYTAGDILYSLGIVDDPKNNDAVISKMNAECGIE
ncbi:MAG: hypothetical protein J7K26_03310 [Candidatus Aenigmarchaeota archaeon]|nr:hypothetical protein [Candidatus Aenigmarchaeota archaeon]